MHLHLPDFHHCRVIAHGGVEPAAALAHAVVKLIVVDLSLRLLFLKLCSPERLC